jgi:hypothetical protein
VDSPAAGASNFHLDFLLSFDLDDLVDVEEFLASSLTAAARARNFTSSVDLIEPLIGLISFHFPASESNLNFVSAE